MSAIRALPLTVGAVAGFALYVAIIGPLFLIAAACVLASPRGRRGFRMGMAAHDDPMLAADLKAGGGRRERAMRRFGL